MRFFALFASILIIVFGIFITSAILYDEFSGREFSETQLKNYLSNASDSKAERVEWFLYERKLDAELISQDQRIVEYIKTYTSELILEQKTNNFKIVEKDLENLAKINNYLDIILINSKGDLVWSYKKGGDLGTNLEFGEFKDSSLAKLFKKTKNDLGVGVSDPGIYEADGTLSLFVTHPILKTNIKSGKRELQGLIALQIDNSKMQNLVISGMGLDSLGEVYIVNRDRRNITPIKYKNKYDSDQKIDSSQVSNCFHDYNNFYIKRAGKQITEVPKTSEYKNYVTQEVFGSHQYILQSNWCVMSEVSKKTFNENFTTRPGITMIYAIIISLIFLVVLSVFAYLASRSFVLVDLKNPHIKEQL